MKHFFNINIKISKIIYNLYEISIFSYNNNFKSIISKGSLFILIKLNII